MDQHETLCAVKELALELGRTPSRREFEMKYSGGKYSLEKTFGTFTALLIAAGLETYGDRQKKITNAIFERDIVAHTEAFKPRELAPPLPWPRISAISDIHFPFAHQKVLQRFYERVEEFQPEWIFVNGDAWDMYSHSKFPRSHNQFTPREEHQLARAQNEAFWIEVRKRVPSAQCIQMLGNHDVRPLKRVLESYPEAEDWITEMLHKSLTFDGVKTIFDSREEFLIGDIAIFHGYRSELGAHRDFTLMNCINGHTHVGGATFRQVHGRTIWELNSGLAGDPEAKGLTYTPQKITKWTLGFAEVDHLGPRFIPLR
jgi:predicted phosphodiesterase